MTRTTSTSQNPSKNIPLPERVEKKRPLKTARSWKKQEDCWAAVSKVLACDGKDYHEGRGLQEVFKYRKEVSQKPSAS